MGNSSGKEARHPQHHDGHTRPSGLRPGLSPTSSSTTAGGPSSSNPLERLQSDQEGRRTERRSRGDLAFLGRGQETAQPEARRETRAEKEARKLAKERALRLVERERSLKTESVDGGYLVTLGVYTGPEDFNKAVVRQLMIERRLAPFWRGLNDHSESWTEHQYVAVAKGLPLPPADEVPTEEPPLSAAAPESVPSSPGIPNINHLTVPMTSRSMSANSESSLQVPAYTTSSLPATSPLTSPASPSFPFFRGRAKTLAALSSTSSKNGSQTDMTPPEIQLPREPYYNGQRVETFLYRNATECPICFMYYPPYLNTTRCCEQPICSECFVQIKRPDPHPPEHHDPTDPHAPPPTENPGGDGQLISEVATCPYCKQPELGVTYDAPPFRRGLSYALHGSHGRLGSATSAMSSSSSLNMSDGMSAPPQRPTRRRAGSLPPTSPAVITTDKVRPDWAKKLSDARLNAQRRAAAATALHNAAYLLGNQSGAESSRGILNRRRRTLFGGESPSGGRPGEIDVAALLAAAAGARVVAVGANSSSGGAQEDGQADGERGRHAPRQQRMQDLEELMIAEAIRLSLAAEEERRKKEEKEREKERLKEEKKAKKEAEKEIKRAEKTDKKRKSIFGLANSSRSSQVGGSSTNVNFAGSSSGKGKAVDRSGSMGSIQFADVSTSSSTTVPNPAPELSTRSESQRYLEESRSQLSSSFPADQFQPHIQSNNPYSSFLSATAPTTAITSTNSPAVQLSAPRGYSITSISSSSSNPDSIDAPRKHTRDRSSSAEPSPNHSGLNSASSEREADESPSATEPLLNFSSLAAVIGREDDGEGSGKVGAKEGPMYIEDVTAGAEKEKAKEKNEVVEHGLEESVLTVRAGGGHTEHGKGGGNTVEEQAESNSLAKVRTDASNPFDAKHYGDVGVLEHKGQEGLL